MTKEQTTRPGRAATRVALWLLPVFVVWLAGFIFLTPGDYLEDWLPWIGAALLSVLPLLVGLGFAIRGLRLGDRLAWLAIAAHGLLLAFFAGLPLVQRFIG
jgi:hypothetical protein